jgi:long-chain acyl-CoA synthetase
MMTRWALEVGERAIQAGLARDELQIEKSWKLRFAERLVLSKARAAAGGAMRFFVSTAGTLSEETVSFFLAIGLPILEGFGIPETCGVLSQNSPTAYRRGSRGRPLEGIELRAGPDGEIEVRGSFVMKGYHSPGGEAPRGVSPDRWLSTGVRGRLDKDRFLKLAGP